jgi:hypothetical protein
VGAREGERGWEKERKKGVRVCGSNGEGIE